jgi:hypothetical protein
MVSKTGVIFIDKSWVNFDLTGKLEKLVRQEHSTYLATVANSEEKKVL